MTVLNAFAYESGKHYGFSGFISFDGTLDTFCVLSWRCDCLHLRCIYPRPNGYGHRPLASLSQRKPRLTSFHQSLSTLLLVTYFTLHSTCLSTMLLVPSRILEVDSTFPHAIKMRLISGCGHFEAHIEVDDVELDVYDTTQVRSKKGRDIFSAGYVASEIGKVCPAQAQP